MNKTAIEWHDNPKRTSSHGYVLVKIGKDHHLADINGETYEHRLMAEIKLGRPLRKGEIVHHNDLNKQNNAPGNLEITVGNSGHFCFHRKRNDLRKTNDSNPEIACLCGCGATFLKYDESNRPRQFLSGHNVPIKERDLCHCGCGGKVKTIGRKYVPNHWSKRHKNLRSNEEILCACACAGTLLKFDKWGRERHFITGHNN